jgi:hypothetical protein
MGLPERVEGCDILGDLIDAFEIKAVGGDPFVESLVAWPTDTHQLAEPREYRSISARRHSQLMKWT